MLVDEAHLDSLAADLDAHLVDDTQDVALGRRGVRAHDVQVLLVADAPVDQRHVDLSVGHGLDVLVFGIHEARTEDQVRRGVEIQDLLPNVEEGDLASAAARHPVDREFRLRHG